MEPAVVAEYVAGVAKIQAVEMRAGVIVGAWRVVEPDVWNEAIRLGLRRRVALEERAERLARS